MMVVARTHAAGLYAAQQALREWAAGGSPPVALLGLVLVADAPGRLPRRLAHLATVVAGAAPASMRVPFIQRLRVGETVTASDSEIRKTIKALNDLTDSHS